MKIKITKSWNATTPVTVERGNTCDDDDDDDRSWLRNKFVDPRQMLWHGGARMQGQGGCINIEIDFKVDITTATVIYMNQQYVQGGHSGKNSELFGNL